MAGDSIYQKSYLVLQNKEETVLLQLKYKLQHLKQVHVKTFFSYQGTGILDQIVGTALLLFCLRAITDEQNMKVPQHLIPMVSTTQV